MPKNMQTLAVSAFNCGQVSARVDTMCSELVQLENEIQLMVYDLDCLMDASGETPPFASAYRDALRAASTVEASRAVQDLMDKLKIASALLYSNTDLTA